MPVTRSTITVAGTAAIALPQAIVEAGPVVVERFLEFFAAQLANDRTRAAYACAAGQFLDWCAARGLSLRAIAPLRVLCDWLVVKHVLPTNPAAAVRGPKHVVTKGATPVLTPEETRQLLDQITRRRWSVSATGR